MSQDAIPRLAEYISTALSLPLPHSVEAKTKLHVLDTAVAMITGSQLKPGKAAIAYVCSQGGTPESMIVSSGVLTNATNAAMANGMLAHSNETDDSHAPSLTHPGCAIIPAALAVGEREAVDGEMFLRAVALGYDISSRIGRAMGGITAKDFHGHATHSIGPMFGATASASALANLNEQQTRYALAYAAQQSSGIVTWERDSEHVEKAFVFGGMGARNGVTSALFAESGMSGEENVFTGQRNFLEIYCPKASELDHWISTLGSHYEISITNIKRFSVGSPIQAAADAMVQLVKDHGLTPEYIESVKVLLPPGGAKIVDGRTMPDVNLQYILAVIILDGGILSFEATHTYERLFEPTVKELMSRISLKGDKSLEKFETQRPATVKITLTDGQKLEKHVAAVRGTADNPMTKAEVEEKARELLANIMGERQINDLIESIFGLDKSTDVLSLRPLLTL